MKKILEKIYIVIFAISVLINLVFTCLYINSHAFAKSVAVLLYHDIDTIENQDKYYPCNFITTKNFEKHMTFLKKHHYKTLTLDEFYDFVQNKKKLPKRSVLITFDTGRKNVLKNGYPILKKYKFHAVYFLYTKAISDDDAHLSKKDLDSVKDVFEYAHHTHNLHYLLKKGDFSSSALLITPEEEIKNDIAKSMKYADKPYFAYPYGRYNEHVIKVLKEIGIKAAFTTRRGRVKPGDDLYTLKRNPISQKISFEKFTKIIGYDNYN